MMYDDEIRPAYERQTSAKTKSRVTSAVLAFLLGWLGVHKFYLGYGTVGFLYLLVTIFSWFMIFSLFFSLIGVVTLYIPVILSFVDAIRYLTMTDEEFHMTYVDSRREWF